MNPQNEAGESSKQSLIGRWRSVEDRFGAWQEYTFEPGHSFRAIIHEQNQETRVWGYWDVTGNLFRMGPTAAQVDTVPISIQNNEVVITKPDGSSKKWLLRERV